MYTKEHLGTASGTTYTVTGLTAATAYTFSIKAKDAAGIHQLPVKL
jgi:chitodextrinase